MSSVHRGGGGGSVAVSDIASRVSALGPILHQGWVEIRKVQGHHWQRNWLILQGNTLLRCTSPDCRPDEISGALFLDDTLRVTKVLGEDRGYRFELSTPTETFLFKCYSNNESELWRGYIAGVATKSVPTNLQLPATLISLIVNTLQKLKLPRQDLSAFQRVRTRSRHSQPPSYRDEVNNSIAAIPDIQAMNGQHSQTDSGFSEMLPQKNVNYQSRRAPERRAMFHTHRFYRDGGTMVPSWFFASCSRQLAEDILLKGGSFGNVLMRESVTFRESGSYVISMRRDGPRGPEFEHFELIRVMGGYRINVENPHRPLSCLGDVMDYFSSVVGPQHVEFLQTNNLDSLGIKTVDYQSKISSREHLDVDDIDSENIPPLSRSMDARDEVFYSRSPPSLAASRQTWTPGVLSREQNTWTNIEPAKPSPVYRPTEQRGTSSVSADTNELFTIEEDSKPPIRRQGSQTSYTTVYEGKETPEPPSVPSNKTRSNDWNNASSASIYVNQNPHADVNDVSSPASRTTAEVHSTPQQTKKKKVPTATLR